MSRRCVGRCGANRRGSAVDRAGELLAGALAGGVRDDGGLAERQLQRLQAVAQRRRVEELISVALASSRPASAWIRVRASSRSLCLSRSSASPRFTAAALIRCRATVEIISRAGTSAMSRVMASKSGGRASWPSVVTMPRTRRAPAR